MLDLLEIYLTFSMAVYFLTSLCVEIIYLAFAWNLMKLVNEWLDSLLSRKLFEVRERKYTSLYVFCKFFKA